MDESALHPLTVAEIRQDDDTDAPILVLHDDLQRTLEIPIGLCEALAIQIGLDAQSTERPLTHDLMLVVANRLHAPISRIIIDDYSAKTYFARIILNGTNGPVSLDCRPSDGIALALRTKAPILASEDVMTAQG